MYLHYLHYIIIQIYMVFGDFESVGGLTYAEFQSVGLVSLQWGDDIWTWVEILC